MIVQPSDGASSIIVIISFPNTKLERLTIERGTHQSFSEVDPSLLHRVLF